MAPLSGGRHYHSQLTNVGVDKGWLLYACGFAANSY